MAVTYRKLWHILIDKKMMKKDLQTEAGLSRHTMLMLSRDENVTTETLGKICAVLKCKTDDILEFVSDNDD